MTQQLGVYKCENIFKKTVWLVDTPGFDDTFRSDAEILQDIALFFAQLYNRNIKFSGLVYLHRITDPRMSGTAIKNLEAFKRICGDRAFPIVRLLTTHWNTLDDESSYDKATQREKQLASDAKFFHPLMEKGGRMMRQERLDSGSSRVVIDSLLDREIQIPLSIQFEMTTQARQLRKTAAGLFLDQERELEAQRCETELQELATSMDQARQEHDKRAFREMATERLEFFAKREKFLRERRELKISLSQLEKRDLQRWRAANAASRMHTASDNDPPPLGPYTEHQNLDESKHMAGRHVPDGDPTDCVARSHQMPHLPSTAQRYRALERGTLRDGLNNRSDGNQMEKIMKWLYAFAS